jgi:hypothetical protein
VTSIQDEVAQLTGEADALVTQAQKLDNQLNFLEGQLSASGSASGSGTGSGSGSGTGSGSGSGSNSVLSQVTVLTGEADALLASIQKMDNQLNFLEGQGSASGSASA